MSNDANNSALITGINDILQYIHIENKYFKLKSYLIMLCFYCTFGQINAPLMNI